MPVRLRGAPRDIKVCNFEIEYEDVFHMKTLYKRMYDFLVEEGWKAAESDGDDNNYETLYWERKNQSDGMDHHVWWRCFRVPEGNRYYRYFLKIDMQTLNMKKIEVMHKGQKFGTNKGDVIIRVESYVQIDYRDEWEKNSITNYFKEKFKERIYAQEIDAYKKDLYAATYRLNTLIKQYLQLKNPMADWGRSFHPEKGI